MLLRMSIRMLPNRSDYEFKKCPGNLKLYALDPGIFSSL